MMTNLIEDHATEHSYLCHMAYYISEVRSYIEANRETDANRAFVQEYLYSTFVEVLNRLDVENKRTN